ncbi:MAG: hypothetical protein ACM362_10600 [Candidatus Methylomirabilota bacterium]
MRPRSSRETGPPRSGAPPQRGVVQLGWVTLHTGVTPHSGVPGLRWMWTLVLCVVVSLGLTGCPGGESPTPTPPPRPAQPAQARPASPAVAPAPAAAPARPMFVYESRGRRDPFRPLIEPRVRAVKTGPKIGLAALEVNEIKLSGIIWEQRGFLALVEAPDGKGYVLRVNDTIGGDARVTKITPEGVTFEVRGPTPLPQVRTRLVELRLRKEE